MQQNGRIAKALDFALLVEPLWTWTAAFTIWFSNLAPVLSPAVWPAFAAMFLPPALRLLRTGRLGRRTPFDVPILLIVAGAVVGAIVFRGPNAASGLGTLVVLVLLYYSVVNHRRPGTYVVILVALLGLGLAAASLFALSSDGPRTPASIENLKSLISPIVTNLPRLTQPADQPYPIMDFAHGYALVAATLGAILLGLALGSRNKRVALFAGIGTAFVAGVVLAATWGSLLRAVTLDSFEYRAQVTWVHALSMLLSDWKNALLGTGLGSGPLLVVGGGHLSNAYLELWVNAGFLGLAGAAWGIVAGARLSLGLLRAPKQNLWRGLALGLVLASLVAAGAGLLESSPFAYYIRTDTSYLWMASPLPWLLAASLVAVERLMRASNC